MTVQWMIVSYFLYGEIAVTLLLCLPFIQPKTWQYLFKSRILALVASYGNLCFTVLIGLLLVLFADAIREIQKYNVTGAKEVDLKNNPNTQDHIMMKLFRAQRNLYISGFALFLLIVVRRLAQLISCSATLAASNEAIKKQAENASKTAEALLKNNDGKKDKDGEGDVNAGDMKQEIEELKKELEAAKKAETSAQNDLNAMKAQAKSVSDEYDRLMKEHEKLQKQVEGGGDKKDE